LAFSAASVLVGEAALDPHFVRQPLMVQRGAATAAATSIL
jgi:hypothetical protein